MSLVNAISVFAKFHNAESDSRSLPSCLLFSRCSSRSLACLACFFSSSVFGCLVDVALSVDSSSFCSLPDNPAGFSGE